MEASSLLANGTPALKCVDCDTMVFNLLDLLRHKRVCEGRVCVICMDKKAESIVEPCLHNKFCAECIYKVLLSSSNCPYCRTVIQKVHGTIFITQEEAMNKAVRLATNNFMVMSQVDTLIALEWNMFIATMADDVVTLTGLKMAEQLIRYSWPIVEEKALGLLHQQQLSFQQSVDSGELMDTSD